MTIRISSARAISVVLPDEDPNWKFAGHAYPANYAVLVVLEADDGTTGYGYASAFPHLRATPEGVRAVIDRITPRLVGTDVLAIEANLATVANALPGNLAAKSGVDGALHDLAAKVLGVPLHVLFGGKVRDRIPLSRMLGLKSPEEMAERAGRLLREGYRAMKLKLSGDVNDDLRRTIAVREEVGDDVRLTVDPNQSYSPKDALRYAHAAVDLNVALIEQPVPSDDLNGLAYVTTHSPIAIEADESATALRDVLHLVSARRVDAVSLKISKMGGLRNVRTAAEICEVGDVGYRFGATVGSQLLVAQGVHLAATMKQLSFACELSEHKKLLNDPFTGLRIIDGEVVVPGGVGTGVDLTCDLDELERHASAIA